jgi:hypothetical protein
MRNVHGRLNRLERQAAKHEDVDNEQREVILDLLVNVCDAYDSMEQARREYHGPWVLPHLSEIVASIGPEDDE